MPALINPYAFPPGTMLSAIQKLGLATPKLCLDASDINSVASGSQTKWLDVSGNGYDFFRGTDATSQTSDPTFNGTPGGQSSSEYYGFDGGDYFTYDSANETWMNNISKNNALFTLAAWVHLPATGAAITGTITADSTKGCWLFGSSGTKLRFYVLNATGTAILLDSTATHNLGQWVFLAVSIDEAAGTGTLQVNATQEAPATTYTSPLATNSDKAMQIAADGSTAFVAASGARLSALVAWEGVSISAANLLSLFNTTKSKFGI